MLKAYKQRLVLKNLNSTELAAVQTKLDVVSFYKIILLVVRYFILNN